MRVSPEEYEPLKAFFIRMSEMILPTPGGLAEQDRPGAVLAMFEAKSRARARQSLAIGIGDIVEMCEGFSPEQVRALDSALAADGIITLSGARARFGRNIRATMKRGAVRDEGDYHALRNVVDAMADPERTEAWRLLGEFEARAGQEAR